jgi:hypothetical protein
MENAAISNCRNEARALELLEEYAAAACAARRYDDLSALSVARYDVSLGLRQSRENIAHFCAPWFSEEAFR